MAAFVRNVNRARVLTVDTVMKPGGSTPATHDIAELGPTLRPHTVIQDALAAILNSDTPVPVISEDGKCVGTVSRHDVMKILANDDAEPTGTKVAK